MTIIAIILAWLLINTWICLFIGTDETSIERFDLFPIFMNSVFSYFFFWVLRQIIKQYKKFKKCRSKKRTNCRLRQNDNQSADIGKKV